MREWSRRRKKKWNDGWENKVWNLSFRSPSPSSDPVLPSLVCLVCVSLEHLQPDKKIVFVAESRDWQWWISLRKKVLFSSLLNSFFSFSLLILALFSLSPYALNNRKQRSYLLKSNHLKAPFFRSNVFNGRSIHFSKTHEFGMEEERYLKNKVGESYFLSRHFISCRMAFFLRCEGEMREKKKEMNFPRSKGKT